MDSTGPPTAPTTLYTNAASPAAKTPSSTPSRPPNGENGSTGGNRNKYNNKNRNSGNDGGNNDMNNNGGGGRSGSSDQTTVLLVPTAGPTHLRPPVARAHEYVPQPRACWTAASAGLRSHTRPLRVSRPPVRATAAATTTVVPAGRPDPRMKPLARRRLGPAVAGQLLQHHDALLAPTSVQDWRRHRSDQSMRHKIPQQQVETHENSAGFGVRKDRGAYGIRRLRPASSGERSAVRFEVGRRRRWIPCGGGQRAGGRGSRAWRKAWPGFVRQEEAGRVVDGGARWLGCAAGVGLSAVEFSRRACLPLAV
jgi:hypothetical protein